MPLAQGDEKNPSDTAFFYRGAKYIVSIQSVGQRINMQMQQRLAQAEIQISGAYDERVVCQFPV
jgi:hypothetical protein